MISDARIAEQHRCTAAVDCHTHTHFSHDSAAEPRESVRMARERGLQRVAFTDHCDIEFWADTDIRTPIKQSATAATACGALVGVEIGEGLWSPAAAREVLAGTDFDIVLGSVHAVRYPQWDMPYAQIDFAVFSDEMLAEFLSVYFSDVQELAKKGNFDVLAHLTCPLRYICGKYGRTVALEPYAQTIDAIFDTVIARGIALEVNTSGLGTAFGELMPYPSLLSRYRQRGGSLLTLGSDAHVSQRVGFGFAQAIAVLRELGFGEAYYYEKRKAIAYSLEGAEK